MSLVTGERARRGGVSFWALVSARTARYPVAVVLVSGGLIATSSLRDSGVETYAPLVGSVAISCWYGGVGPGLLAIAIGWATSWFGFVSPHWPPRAPDGTELTTWLAPLAVALVVLLVSWALRRAGERAEVRAESIERKWLVTDGVRELATELSSALTPSDVAHTLVQRMPGLLGSTGAALGLVVDGGLEIVDPAGAPKQTLAPGLRLPLDARAPMTTAARTGEVTLVATRDRFERDYPDGAALARDAAGALAVPLRAAGHVIGSIGFPFRDPDAIDAEVVALARLAADIGGQALERAGLYQQERDLRTGLDRILRLAPLFDSESPESVARLICEEARTTFAAEIAQLWSNADDEAFDVVWREPPSDVIPPGTRVAVSDFPGLTEAMRRLEPMFIPDSWENVGGLALQHARHFGIRSSLRVPIAVAGRAEFVLVLQWTRVISEPQPSTIGLARRFADQAGLAFEHAERRVAQDAAFRNAEEIRRLSNVTAALSAALDPAAVAEAILGEAFEGLGASAGLVVRPNAAGELAVLAAEGYPADVLEQWSSFARGADAPLAHAVQRSEIIALESPDELARRYPGVSAHSAAHGAWLSIPLVAAGHVVGGLGLSFGSPRSFSDGDREFGLALSRQGGQALERSHLLETEQLARRQAERMAGDLAQLHALATSLGRAGGATQVARVVGEQLIRGVGAATAGVYTFTSDRRELALVGVEGRLAGGVAPVAERLPSSDDGPIARAARSGRAIWWLEQADWPAVPFAAAWRDSGAGALGVVPLLVEQEVIGVLFAVFDEDRTSDEDRRFVEIVARQAAQPLERARRYEAERTIAETLQRSVLPETLPSLEGATVTARYLPGTASMSVGGDWFDTIPLADGRLAFVVGDVVGKGVRAASTMAQLRNGLRALVLDSSEPGSIVTKLNRLLEGYTDSPFATLALLTVDPVTQDAALVSAGHLPPLVLVPGSEPRWLEGGRGFPLGVDPDTTYEPWSTRLEPGSVIVLYTDGLVERRDRPLDDGLRLLAQVAAEARPEADELVDHLISRLVGEGDRDDDVAVLIVALDRAPLGTFTLRFPADRDSLVGLRHAFSSWLERGGIAEADRHDLVRATWEATARTIELAGDRPETVGVEASLSGDRVRIEVTGPAGLQRAGEPADRARGMRLIETLMTAAATEQVDGGVRVVMERALSREPAGEPAGDADVQPGAPG
jgi:serine phosphatase RsbU (regulator of sigma subunit)/transcriptional regulator with GAF, ATPase, and Fis domain